MSRCEAPIVKALADVFSGDDYDAGRTIRSGFGAIYSLRRRLASIPRRSAST